MLGWDSAFEVNGQTYAEMDAETKNESSHRFKALKSFQTWYMSLEEDQKADNASTATRNI